MDSGKSKSMRHTSKSQQRTGNNGSRIQPILGHHPNNESLTSLSSLSSLSSLLLPISFNFEGVACILLMKNLEKPVAQ